MRRFVFIITVFVSVATQAQVLRDINYSYLYDANESFSFDLRPVRQADGWTLYYKLQVNDTAQLNQYTIQWEVREALGDKNGLPLSLPTTVLTSGNGKTVGQIKLDLQTKDQIIAAKVTNVSAKRLWMYYTILDQKYPVIGFLKNANGDVVFDPYVNPGQPFSVGGFSGAQSLVGSYYNDDFPSAAPAFSEGQARVSKAILPDSTFTISTDQSLTFYKKGLYLIQKDTSAVEGIAFRVEAGYPKFTRLQDLVGPFIYVCTKQEFEKLKSSGSDKKQFDKGVLNITQDAGRAREFMRTYFQRAEAANQFFTSYKEGWKTDRGMIYLIYGPPKTIYKFADREVWTYGKTTFNFIRSSTLFDPDNFVLIRNKKITQEWYEKVDLIRNSVF